MSALVAQVPSSARQIVAKPNTKTNASEIVFFILLPFQKLYLPPHQVRDKLQQGTVNIFTPHTMRTLSGLGLSLRKYL